MKLSIALMNRVVLISLISALCFIIIITGPVTYRPDPIEKVADLGSDGTLSMNEPDLKCETKGGSAGAEGEE